MEFNGKSPNGLNQLSASLVSLFVSGGAVINVSPQSVNVLTDITASGVQTSEINPTVGGTLSIQGNTKITGSLLVSSSISASSVVANTLVGDGSGITNIPASSIGDIDRIKSGSVQTIISPNKGLEVQTSLTVKDFLVVTGSGIFRGDLSVAGTINTTELKATYISASIIFASGSNKFGDNVVDKHEFTGIKMPKDIKRKRVSRFPINDIANLSSLSNVDNKQKTIYASTMGYRKKLGSSNFDLQDRQATFKQLDAKMGMDFGMNQELKRKGGYVDIINAKSAISQEQLVSNLPKQNLNILQTNKLMRDSKQGLIKVESNMNSVLLSNLENDKVNSINQNTLIAQD